MEPVPAPVLIGPVKPKPNFSAISENTSSVSAPQVKRWIDQARQFLSEKKPEHALNVLERAVRIAPRDPWVWHELARTNFLLRRYEQAEAMAKKSIAYSGTDEVLRRRNEMIVRESKQLR